MSKTHPLSKVLIEQTKSQEWRLVSRNTTTRGFSRLGFVVLDDAPDLTQARQAYKNLMRYMATRDMRNAAE